MTSCTINNSLAYTLMFLTLAVFAVTALFFAYRFGKITLDRYLVSRATQSTKFIAWSLYSSAMGSWILFAIPEVGASMGAWGVAGYAIANVTPYVLVCFIGPVLRRVIPSGITLTDFLEKRYNIWMRLWAALISLFYMYVFMVAEMTGVGSLARYLAPEIDYRVPIIAVSVTTCIYTAIGGMPVTMITDLVQGVLSALLTLYASTLILATNDADAERLKEVAAPTNQGFHAFLILLIAVVGSNYFNTGIWQRVWASRDDKALILGCLFSGSAILLVSVILGLAGMWAMATNPEIIPGESFFIGCGTSNGAFNCSWSYIVLVLAVALVCAVVDTLQNAICAELTQLLAAMKVDKLVAKLGRGEGESAMVSKLGGSFFLLARVLTVLLNIPAIFLAVKQVNILQLFLIADLVACTCFLPSVLGFWRKTNSWVALSGSFAGLLSILIYGWARTGTFVGGFEQITLPDGFYSLPTLYSFLLAIGVSGFWTIAGSLLLPEEKDLSFLTEVKDDGHSPAFGTSETPNSKLDVI